MNIYDPKILFSFTYTLNDHSLAKMDSFNRLSFECQDIFNNNIKHIVNLHIHTYIHENSKETINHFGRDVQRFKF